MPKSLKIFVLNPEQFDNTKFWSLIYKNNIETEIENLCRKVEDAGHVVESGELHYLDENLLKQAKRDLSSAHLKKFLIAINNSSKYKAKDFKNSYVSLKDRISDKLDDFLYMCTSKFQALVTEDAGSGVHNSSLVSQKPNDKQQLKLDCNDLNKQKASRQDVINNATDFEAVFKHLTEEQRREVFEVTKSKFQNMINFAWDLKAVLLHLTEEQRVFVFDTIQDKFPGIITDRQEFIVISSLIPQNKRKVFFELLKAKLQEDIIKDVDDFKKIFDALTDCQRTDVLQGLIKGQKLETIIKTISDLVRVLNHITVDQCKTVCQYFLEDTNDPAAFQGVLKGLDEEKRELVFNFKKNTLRSIIKNGTDFCRVLEFLTIDQRKEVYEVMKDRFQFIIKDSIDFCNVLAFLTIDERKEFYEDMKDHLTNIFQSKGDVQDFRYARLDKDVKKTVLRNLFIKTISDYKSTRENENSTYMHGWMGIFQKSKEEKIAIAEVILEALKGNKVDLNVLQSSMDIIRNGRLGQTIRELVKMGCAGVLFDKRIDTIRDFVNELASGKLTVENDEVIADLVH